MLFYEFEYKSAPQERLNKAHIMMGEVLKEGKLSMLFKGCLTLKTFEKLPVVMHGIHVHEHTPKDFWQDICQVFQRQVERNTL